MTNRSKESIGIRSIHSSANKESNIDKNLREIEEKLKLRELRKKPVISVSNENDFEI